MKNSFKIIAVIMAILLVICLCSCGKDEAIALPNETYVTQSTVGEQREYEVVFNNINIDKDSKIVFTYSDTAYVDSTVDQVLVNDYGFETTVDNGVITIGTDEQHHFSTKKFEVFIKANVKKITVNGTIDCEINAEKYKKLAVLINGAGKLNLVGATADELSLTVNGAGDISLEGEAETFGFITNGAGSADARKLVSKNASVNIQGAGSVELSVTKNLDALISGAGSVGYYGEPELSKEIAGIAKVKQISKSVYTDN